MGGIILLIRRTTASFGKLQGESLELKEGLNIIQAPNETGKSTWCAFLIAMLYGINSRERDKAGFIAEKNRYAPWSGASMSGRLDCRAGEDELTLTRTTRRQTAPMGDFQAVYAGTADPFPLLTGQNCGETLLGVTREVFERSAFIRQSGLAISQDAGLERRIASLITSGEEDTSYSETADLLKKQLNRRRHNKTGQIPVLEEALQTLRCQLADQQQLEEQLLMSRSQITQLEAAEAALTAELTRMQTWETAEKYKTLQDAEAIAERAEQTAAALREQLAADRIPENETIARLRGALLNLEASRKAAESARTDQAEAAKALAEAESALQESPFAGKTPEQVRVELAEPQQAKAPVLPAFLLSLAMVAAVAAIIYLIRQSPLAIPAAIPFGVAVSAILGKRARSRANTATLIQRFGTADPTAISALADTYYKLYAAQQSAKSALAARSAAADTLRDTFISSEQAILMEIRRFSPSAFDSSAADTLLDECARRRKAAADAEAIAREARIRCDLMAQQLPALPESFDTDVPRPLRSRSAVQAELDRTRAELSAARSSADRLSGQIHAAGDPVVLRSTITQMESELQQLEAEYAAIRMAMEALEQANTTLQNRFSPALGRRAAEIFHALSGGRYNGVALDRSFRLSAEPTDDIVYRDAQLLSAGASDQLYLAVRLAICELVLPAAPSVPIVLDDALANFDDDRCAAALRWLKEAAKTRQILLFTCHEREAAFFAEDKEVSVLRLTNPAVQV